MDSFNWFEYELSKLVCILKRATFHTVLVKLFCVIDQRFEYSPEGVSRFC